MSTAPLVFMYADESCLGNQNKNKARPGGAGGLAEYYHPEQGWVRRDFWMSEPDTTNNRMAIRSAILGLSSLRAPSRIVFTSDSRYLVDGMSSWVRGWMRKGWQRKGGPIENLELWQELVVATTPHRVEWRWVKGHAGHAYNEYANFLATRAAAEQTQSGGLIVSGFAAWLAGEREAGRYADFDEAARHQHTFKPAPAFQG